MDITIRKAKVEDKPFIAKMILQSSRHGKKFGLFDLLLEDLEDVERLKFLEGLCDTKTKYNLKNFLIAELDEKQVGSLCSYEYQQEVDEEFIELFEKVGVHKDTLLEELHILQNCDFNLSKKTLMFDCMEEVEDFIDVGVLKALMQKSLLNARFRGYRVAKTVVEIGALDTLLFYKKLGFKEIEEKECEAYRERYGRSGFVLLAIEF
ncbi:hypothetical protein MNB_SM-3-1043 [hydrothermal vent metagenome]|uniref:Acyl-CoA acyltransferase n=1 Tax=hydrothermal vent metagenome TaxID=652676 RepID=A0A1W1D4V8_9ZZZZ